MTPLADSACKSCRVDDFGSLLFPIKFWFWKFFISIFSCLPIPKHSNWFPVLFFRKSLSKASWDPKKPETFGSRSKISYPNLESRPTKWTFRWSQPLKLFESLFFKRRRAFLRGVLVSNNQKLLELPMWNFSFPTPNLLGWATAWLPSRTAEHWPGNLRPYELQVVSN